MWEIAGPPHAQAEVSPPRAWPVGVPPPTGTPGQWLYNTIILVLLLLRCPLSFMWSSFHILCHLPPFRFASYRSVKREKKRQTLVLEIFLPNRSGVVSSSRVFWPWLETIVLELDSREKKSRSCRLPTDSVKFDCYCPIRQCLGRCLKAEQWLAMVLRSVCVSLAGILGSSYSSRLSKYSSHMYI